VRANVRQRKEKEKESGFTEYRPNVLLAIQPLTLIRRMVLKITLTPQIRSNQLTPLRKLRPKQLGNNLKRYPCKFLVLFRKRLAWSLRFSRFWRNVLEGTGKEFPVNPPAEVRVIIIEDSDGVKPVIGSPWLS
jgi:hypothetical protein